MPYHDLNLSARPYRNYRTFLIIRAVLYGLTLGISWVNFGNIARKLTLTEATKTRIHKLEGEINALRTENQRISESLGEMNFKQIGGTAGVINGLLAQRAFSWSRILETLEKTLPDNVRLTFLGTSADQNGTLVLHLACISSSREGMIRTVESLQGDPALADVVPLYYQDQETGTPLGVKFDVEARYVGDRP